MSAYRKTPINKLPEYPENRRGERMWTLPGPGLGRQNLFQILIEDSNLTCHNVVVVPVEGNSIDLRYALTGRTKTLARIKNSHFFLFCNGTNGLSEFWRRVFDGHLAQAEPRKYGVMNP